MGLNGTGKQTKKHHGQGHDQRDQINQHSHSQFVSKDVSKQTEGEGEGLGEFLDDLEREHDWGRLHVQLEESQSLAAQTCIEVRQRHQKGHRHSGVDVRGWGTKLTFRQLDDFPGNQRSAPVAHKNEQEQGADERKPIAVVLLADLIPGQISDEIPKELQQVLQTYRVTLHATGANKHKGQKNADQDPGAQEHLAVQIQITDLPVQVVAHFQFGKRE